MGIDAPAPRQRSGMPNPNSQTGSLGQSPMPQGTNPMSGLQNMFSSFTGGSGQSPGDFNQAIIKLLTQGRGQ